MNIYFAYPRKEAKKWRPFVDGLCGLLPDDQFSAASDAPEQTLWNCDLIVFATHDIGDEMYGRESGEATRLAMAKTWLDGRTAKELARDIAGRGYDYDRAKRQRSALCNELRDTNPPKWESEDVAIRGGLRKGLEDAIVAYTKGSRVEALMRIANLAVSTIVEIRKED